ncbi:hypothetical protein [Halobacillus salinus]|uniref:hypothetical protein n=1 Tax=Halobacillus salinus TaxID=192814 RepID=UPI0009A86A4E|nr:hypothetical protein [Halobacillus salinus]
MSNLYQFVKASQEGVQTEERIIKAFEPKIKSSLRMTKQTNREDLEQELKVFVLRYVREYDIGRIPGLFELNQIQRKKAQ